MGETQEAGSFGVWVCLVCATALNILLAAQKLKPSTTAYWLPAASCGPLQAFPLFTLRGLDSFFLAIKKIMVKYTKVTILTILKCTFQECYIPRCCTAHLPDFLILHNGNSLPITLQLCVPRSCPSSFFAYELTSTRYLTSADPNSTYLFVTGFIHLASCLLSKFIHVGAAVRMSFLSQVEWYRASCTYHVCASATSWLLWIMRGRTNTWDSAPNSMGHPLPGQITGSHGIHFLSNLHGAGFQFLHLSTNTCVFFDSNHLNGCEVVCRHDFDGPFPHDWCWASFHALIGHLCIFFGGLSFRSFAHF